jgi:DHA1 family tetracycline resistance protein-like MFS transporter
VSAESTKVRVPGPGKATVLFILVVVLLDVLAFGIVLPVLPKLIEGFVGGNTARAAMIFGWFGAVWALMQFVFSPILGSLSDRFGRRAVLLVSCFGLGLDYLVMALAPDVRWLLVGRVLSGVMAASWPTAAAYIADVTPAADRAGAFGKVGAVWGLGFIVGPALGGVLGEVSPRLPFWASAALVLLTAFYGLLVLPESLAPENRRPFSWRRANPVGALRLLGSHPELLGLASVNTLCFLAQNVLPSVVVLYTSYRYGWSLRTMGLTLATVGAANIVVQGVLVKPAVARMGERGTMVAGLVFGVAGYAVYGLATTGLAFWFGVLVFAPISLYSSAIQSLMAGHVGPSEQGELQGANNSLLGITGLAGPLLFTSVFALFIGRRAAWHLPGAPFLLASAITAVATVIAWRVLRREKATRPGRTGSAG